MKALGGFAGLLATIAMTTTAARAGDAGTLFTYQGRLLREGKPFTGSVNLTFDLLDAPVGGNFLGFNEIDGVNVVDGLFTVELDYGAEAFDGGPRYLDIGVDDEGLEPRQRLTVAPYALQTRGLFVDGAEVVALARDGTDARLEFTSGPRTAAIEQQAGGDFRLVLPANGDLDVARGNGSTLLTVRGDSTVGIGTETPEARLHVLSDVNAMVVTSTGGTALVVEALGPEPMIDARSGDGTELSVDQNGAFIAGDLVVVGNLTKGSGSFTIDHPLDPANRYLSHSFVESPDMMNVYNGNVKTDEQGRAAVRLPDYFESLNRDFRYQLTVIGTFAQAIVSEEIADGRFVIRTDRPSVKVSWQVTGVRRDPYAERHRIEVERSKPAGERGRYLHPEVYGLRREHALRSAPDRAARSAEGVR